MSAAGCHCFDKYSDIEEENSVCVEKIKILQEELARTNEEIKKLNEKIKTEKKKNDEKTKEILSIKNVPRECEELQRRLKQKISKLKRP